jgi:alkanesulfonate monooxygenase SsuD/methylene tetrahydromethanopterin reductase-like flavin-dependent oxidoreductase (luciferase family)
MESRRRPFKIGVFVPHFELPWNGIGPRWTEIAAMARRAEEVGFDSFWLPDHLIFRFEDVNQQGGWDVWSLMSGIAAITKKIEIAPLVACASFRNPALIAKMADTIDEISGGRFILGLGAGWHKPEYDAFGFPYDYRVSRFEEVLKIIAPLLRTGKVDFEGRFYSARECELRPRGPRPSGPPILVGGGGDRVIRLAATYADAWNVDRKNDVNEVIALKEKVDGVCREVGRDPKTLGRIIGIQVDLLNESRIAMYPRQFVQHPWPLVGTAEELAAKIRDYQAGGVEHMMVWIDPNNLAGIEAFAPVLEALNAADDA